jgi:hypothetical protein
VNRLILSVAAVALIFGWASADFTPINQAADAGKEDSLSQILDILYGAGNYQRVDDANDQVWTTNVPNGTATFQAQYASYAQSFGYAPTSSLPGMILFSTPGGLDEIVPTGGPQGTIPASTKPFYLGDLVTGDDNGTPKSAIWYSDPSLNGGDGDHMVTFEITQGTDAGDYVVAFEDYYLATADKDYNDLVVLVSGAAPVSAVPEPSTLSMLGFGLVGLAALVRRKRKN